MYASNYGLYIQYVRTYTCCCASAHNHCSPLVVLQDSNVKLIRELKAEIEKLKSIILSDVVRGYRRTHLQTAL